MGVDRAPFRRGAAAKWRSAFTLYVLPFCLGLLIILACTRNRDVFRGFSRPGGDYLGPPSKCTGQQRCNCPPAGEASSAAALELASKLSKESVQKVLGAANSTDPADQTVRVNEDKLEDVFLFIGILSGRGYRHRRLAVREAWANRCQQPGIAMCRFILSEDEQTPQVQKEVDQHGDIVFVKERTTYKSILVKTFFVLEYAVAHYDCRYILKTDDDAYVNVAATIHQLRLLCESPGCKQERLYMGRMAKESEVLLQPGHKWNNIVFYNHTGLKTYPLYAMGGGYILSGDVTKILININKKMKLKFTPIEDATLGFWLMSMDIRHIDHPKFWTWAAPCCFKAPVRREGQRIVTRFQLQDELEDDLCSVDPWLILHKIDSPTKMRYLGNRVAACNASDPNAVPPSIAAYVRPKEERDSLQGRGASGDQDPFSFEIDGARRRRRGLRGAGGPLGEGLAEGRGGEGEGGAPRGRGQGRVVRLPDYHSAAVRRRGARWRWGGGLSW